MKAMFALVLLALFAVVAADVSELTGPSNEYLPPFQGGQGGPGSQGRPGFGGQGFGGQSPRGQGFGGRNADGFGPEREYLPPTQNGEPAPGHSFGPDGYRYRNPSQF